MKQLILVIAFTSLIFAQEMIQPKPLESIIPVYPKEAMEKDIEGTVILKCYIDKTGNVTDIEILKGVSSLNDSAKEAVQNVRFSPAKKGNKTFSSSIVIPIKYKLN
jgi:protein TonB